MATDHDQIFKQLLTEFFKEFMELFLPDEAAEIDFGQVKFLEKEYFTDVSRGKKKQLDLVVEAGLKRGGKEFILVHVELQSRRLTDFPLRMYEYYSQLFLRHRKPIIPIAVFADQAIWRKPIADVYELKFLDKVYIQFHYHLIKLKHYSYRDFIKSDNPLAYALMTQMGYDKADRWRLKADFLRLILGARLDAARESILLDFVESYMGLSDSEQDLFNEVIIEENTYMEVEKMVTVYEKRGIEKGMAEALNKMVASGISESEAKKILGIKKRRSLRGKMPKK